MIPRSPATLRLVLGRDSIRSELADPDGALAGCIGYAHEEELRAAVGALVARVPQSARPRVAELLVEPPLLQRRQLTDLPGVSRRELRALVEHQAGRFFRQNGHRLVTDAAWEAGQRGSPRTAMVFAVEEHLVEAVMDEARGAGVPVAAVRPALASDLTRFSLLPPATREARTRAAWVQVRTWARGVLLLWLMTAALVVIRFERERRLIEAELARLEPALVSLRVARQKIAAAEVMLRAVDRAQSQRYQIARQLLAVSRALPESSFVTSLRLSLDGSGAITGEAADPLAVVAALERSEFLAQPRLERTPLRDPGGPGGWTRLAILIGGAPDARSP